MAELRLKLSEIIGEVRKTGIDIKINYKKLGSSTKIIKSWNISVILEKLENEFENEENANFDAVKSELMELQKSTKTRFSMISDSFESFSSRIDAISSQSETGRDQITQKMRAWARFSILGLMLIKNLIWLKNTERLCKLLKIYRLYRLNVTKRVPNYIRSLMISKKISRTIKKFKT